MDENMTRMVGKNKYLFQGKVTFLRELGAHSHFFFKGVARAERVWGIYCTATSLSKRELQGVTPEPCMVTRLSTIRGGGSKHINSS